MSKGYVNLLKTKVEFLDNVSYQYNYFEKGLKKNINSHLAWYFFKKGKVKFI